MNAITSLHAVGGAHAAEARDHLLNIDKVDEAAGQDFLDDQAHLPAGFTSCGLVHAKLVNDEVVTIRGVCSEG